METNHLITRTPSPNDARQNVVVLTETAHQIYTQHLTVVVIFSLTGMLWITSKIAKQSGKYFMAQQLNSVVMALAGARS